MIINSFSLVLFHFSYAFWFKIKLSIKKSEAASKIPVPKQDCKYATDMLRCTGVLISP